MILIMNIAELLCKPLNCLRCLKIE